MLTNKNSFYQHLAQTSPEPLALEIKCAEGCYLYDTNGKRFMDLISGISVSSTGHRHPEVIKAIKAQLDKHLHVMVFGELIQEPQVKLAARLAELLPSSLDTAYFVNSGSEAVEGALKLAKRCTGRHEIIAFKNAYHGSTHGALSVTGSEDLKQRFRPLLPSIKHLEFNNFNDLSLITKQTACVIIEPVQGEAGIVPATQEYLISLREKCDETGSLLIFDEIQTGMGRTGSMFAFEGYGVTPDIILLAKAFGGGLPLGAFIASAEIMQCLSHDPVLGHITTFGGHPLSCAAALANLNVIIKENLISDVKAKADLFIEGLKDIETVKEIRHAGLLIAVQFENETINQQVIKRCLEKGLITDWFLFRPDALRIAPPLTISHKEIDSAVKILREAIREVAG
ncbi:MAG: aspartate aminotransferase family protein [Bacteroidales bacterium]|nr:aspartate aminotransferase family protein [Bacteroidales bacterium]